MPKPKIVYISGVWDLFHVGHLNAIRKASELGDKLVVGVATDEYAASYKRLPTIPFEQRWAIISAIRYVDAVEPTEYNDDIRPMVKHGVTLFIKGPEFGKYDAQGKALKKMTEMGIELILVPRTLGVSSTLIKQRIKEE